jgi:copper chaperone NosL
MRLMVPGLLLCLTVACGPQGPAPADLAVGQEACGFCRMTVSQPEFASQVVVPGELPLFFDDLACLTNYLTSTPDRPADAVVYVTDHQTKAWIRAETAVFSRVVAMSTPMGSHLIAHASGASRAADVTAAGAEPVALDAVLPRAWQAKGKTP